MDFTLFMRWVNLRFDVFHNVKNYVLWNLLIWYFLEWLIGVKSIYTTCKSMKDLLAKTKINCKPGEIIFVNEQSINFLDSDYPTHVINKNECKNSTSSKCFRYLAKDYFSYFNISKSCNGKENCALGYRDMYYSAIQFATSCDYSKGSDFDLLRIGVSTECFHCTYSFDLLLCSFSKISRS